MDSKIVGEVRYHVPSLYISGGRPGCQDNPVEREQAKIRGNTHHRLVHSADHSGQVYSRAEGVTQGLEGKVSGQGKVKSGGEFWRNIMELQTILHISIVLLKSSPSSFFRHILHLLYFLKSSSSNSLEL